MARSPFENQLKNRNLLSPTGFKFKLSKAPKVDFYCQTSKIPGINMGTAIQPSYLKDIAVPGDKVLYDDLTLRFLVDENMENYLEIHNWITGIGYPESVEQFSSLPKEDEIGDGVYSDGTLQILDSNYNPIRQIVFKDLFPVSLTSLDFDSTNRDYEYFSAEVTFKYLIYTITDKNGVRLDNYPPLSNR